MWKEKANLRKTWCVYRHTFPNGKVYIGITSQKPEARWAGGMGYKCNDEMFNDILLYGWRNISHEVLFSGLDEQEAKKREKELISSYGAFGRDKTYNTSHAYYDGSDKVSWLDYRVTNETAPEYRARFSLLNDSWLDPYTQKVGAYPCGANITSDGMEINFFISDEEGYVTHKLLFIKNQRSEMTFREVHQYLNTAPEATVMEGKRFKIPDEWLNKVHEVDSAGKYKKEEA